MHFAIARAPRRVARTLVASACLATACAAQAGTIEPEIGWGFASGNPLQGGDIDTLQIGLGYYLDNGVGARYVGFAILAPNWLFDTNTRAFSEFDGVQLVDHFPVSGRLSGMIGAGIGKSSYDRMSGSTLSASETEGIVTAGLKWKPASHFDLSLQYSYLTQSGVWNLALMAGVPF
jgi:hypothetical protein